MASEPDPPWLRDAARAVGQEIAAYVATTRAILAAPSRFAAEWSSGQRHALNPLAFMLNALAVLGPWRVLWARLLDPNAPATPLWFELLKPALPVLTNLVVTALMHGLLRAMGARRPLRSSLAIALYVSGAPLALMNFFVAPVALYGFVHRAPSLLARASVAANLSVLLLFFVYLVAMESTLHRLPRWRVTLAVLVAWMTYGALSAWVSFHHPDLIRSLLEG